MRQNQEKKKKKGLSNQDYEGSEQVTKNEFRFFETIAFK